MATATPQPGKDPVAVDPKHYQVEYEDQRIRVLRARYNPGERSVMHSHPALIAVMITDGALRFSFPDGHSEEIHAEAGDVLNMPALEHDPENIGDRQFEAVLIELKG